MQDLTATYSPEDNKLRLYASTRLDADLYARVKAHGFKWAPKQDLFVAPMWTPARADFLIELCGEIGDEDQSLAERAEAKAERLEDLSDRKLAQAESSRAAVSAIADNIPLGQPILVGHHSEKHARKDAQRIENGMRRAVQCWEASKYWADRAQGAIRNAKYKERPDVRARRIKGLEADLRKMQKSAAENQRFLAAWLNPEKELTLERAKAIANHDYISRCYPLADYPRAEGASTYEGMMSLWSALGGTDEVGIINPAQARDIAARAHQSYINTAERWIAHIQNRVAYERAMLAADGGTVADKTGPEVGGACRCWASPTNGWSLIQKVNKVSVTLLDNWGNGGRDFTRTIPFDKLHAIMSRAQVDEARAAGRLLGETPRGFRLLSQDAPPAPVARPEPSAQDQQFAQLKEAARAGVQIAVAPQLFPTPPELAERVIEAADIRPGHRVLEPSAGTGRLLGAMGGRMFDEPGKPYAERDQLHAVEINAGLCDRLRREFPLTKVHQADFLSLNRELGTFDRIVMNPPFTMGADIEHVEHALGKLRDDGRLVAIMAGHTGRRKFVELVSSLERDGATIEIETLPPDSFKDAGTSVNTVLVTIQK